MGEECGTQMCKWFLWEDLKERDQVGDSRVDKRILKLVLKNREGWNGFSWLVIGIIG
jgi:hypothetical protein